ncbi:MAG: membrane protein insertion efficiency factor YidD [Deltaproteobacteria bacterium RIFCSPLOWO2_02_FULL_44_10]|nr:MAG: membrane protein insertion efficiency factor YidD [Deltaproteobacteria bacterium RIFCSPHIGHO2_02_FULL_44_16]OGQ45436.1 MAG: membrane protein insertion efficiency factor YidD [Deltaproteobacteria bacterium RIFCSPLOWO2_02_FULL_44_10]
MKILCLAFIRFYQIFLSPFLGRSCRYVPSCSHYAHVAFANYAWPQALWMTIRRLCRCHPFGKFGYDPLHTSQGDFR